MAPKYSLSLDDLTEDEEKYISTTTNYTNNASSNYSDDELNSHIASPMSLDPYLDVPPENFESESDDETPVSSTSSGLLTMEDPYGDFQEEDESTSVENFVDPRDSVERAKWIDEFGGINDAQTKAEIGSFNLDQVLADGIDAGAADVKIKSYDQVVFKILGRTVRQPKYGIIQPETIKALYEIEVEEVLKATFAQYYGLDTSYTMTETRHAGSRARLSVSRERGEMYMVFRLISNTIPTPEQLGIPKEIIEWTHRSAGVIMVNGKTGSGKSTTMASLLNEINMNDPLSIITLEKPIEYLLGNKGQGDVYQRDIGPGLDSVSFAQGLKDALRQSPDIILVGEVRDREEVTTLLEASDSGHLSLTTMHTNSASQTISRIKSLFQGEEERVLDALSSNAVGFCNQLLVLSPDKAKRTAVREILSFEDPEVRQLVKGGHADKLLDYQIDRQATMEHELARGIAGGVLNREEAYRASARPEILTDALKKLG